MRVAMGVEYDGSAFYGWQTQASGRTVQGTLEQALSRVADAAITAHGAGRTDTGVHARGQVLHFDSQAERSTRAWVLGTNSYLPKDVAILWARFVPVDFNARFSATSRRYIYRLINRWVRPALGRAALAWHRQPLDAEAMHRAAQALCGEHDFSSFRALSCQARHAVRRIHEITIQRQDDLIEIIVEGNGFLHHMVRNIVGTLLLVGTGEATEAHLGQVLAKRDRSAAGPTAPASGLCLQRVCYPAAFRIPASVEEGCGEQG